MNWRKIFEFGGWLAGIALVAFGIVSIVMGINGFNTVRDNLAQEKIVFGNAAEDPAVPDDRSGAAVDTGAEARDFANVMRAHALEASCGLTYSEMGRYQASDVKGDDGCGGTSNPEAAATDDNGQPISNGKRETWVTQTALATALNVAYFGEQVALFGVLVGVALFLTGIGFLVLMGFHVLAPEAKEVEVTVARPAVPTA